MTRKNMSVSAHEQLQISNNMYAKRIRCYNQFYSR